MALAPGYDAISVLLSSLSMCYRILGSLSGSAVKFRPMVTCVAFSGFCGSGDTTAVAFLGEETLVSVAFEYRKERSVVPAWYESASTLTGGSGARHCKQCLKTTGNSL
jgi:hypothetical protein